MQQKNSTPPKVFCMYSQIGASIGSVMWFFSVFLATQQQDLFTSQEPKTGTCNWRCNDGLYKSLLPQNLTRSTDRTTHTSALSTNTSTTPTPVATSITTLPWVCKYVFYGSVPLLVLLGVAYGDAQVCSKCTVCAETEYHVSACAIDIDTVCGTCPNAHPDKAHYLGTVTNTSRNVTCDWRCDSGFWLDHGMLYLSERDWQRGQGGAGTRMRGKERVPCACLTSLFWLWLGYSSCFDMHEMRTSMFQLRQ